MTNPNCEDVAGGIPNSCHLSQIQSDWRDFGECGRYSLALTVSHVIQSLVTRGFLQPKERVSCQPDFLHSPWFNLPLLGKWWKSMAYHHPTNILTWSKLCTPPANKISKKIWDDTGQITKMGTGSQKIELAIWAECLPLTIDRNRDMLLDEVTSDFPWPGDHQPDTFQCHEGHQQLQRVQTLGWRWAPGTRVFSGVEMKPFFLEVW
jgi:hypothetical protein